VGARGELPRFRFPAGTSLARGAGAGMGSNTNFTSTSRITSPESAAQLVQQLASQMREQGWSPDADWSGAGSAGSTWRKTIDGQPTWGTLEITGVGKDTYDVEFTSAQP
jgi:hypothetical protein